MTIKKSYKRIALIVSLCLLALWCIIGTGASLAWFTDTTPVQKNVFHVDMLNMEVSHRLDDGTYEKVDATTSVFDDQAIYGFRGADIGNIERFCEDFKESTQIRLEWNYRSVPNVLYLANDIFKNKPIHLRKMLRAGNLNGSGGNPLYKENRKPEVWVSDNPVEEIQKIVESIRELRLGYDLLWKNFAILVRYNRQKPDMLYFGMASIFYYESRDSNKR